jgi:hypothetical protein
VSEYAVVSLAERSDLCERLRSKRRYPLTRMPSPLSVDCERDEPVYVEPGVWMLHP